MYENRCKHSNTHGLSQLTYWGSKDNHNVARPVSGELFLNSLRRAVSRRDALRLLSRPVSGPRDVEINRTMKNEL